MAGGLAHLVDASLLERVGDRYRQLDLIHSDAHERLQATCEEAGVLGRLVDWALEAVEQGVQRGDEIDLMAAVEAARSLDRPELATLARRLAGAWEEIGRWSDAQALYELAARTSGDPVTAIAGAELAWSRYRTDTAVRLFDLAAELALAALDPSLEARAAAGAAEIMARFSATMAEAPETAVITEHVERADKASVAAGDGSSMIHAALARMWLADWAEDRDGLGPALQSALEATRRGGDRVLRSSALDCQASVAVEDLRIDEARAAIDERLQIIGTSDEGDARHLVEVIDILYMASLLPLLVGDFREALARGTQLDGLARSRGVFSGLANLVPANFFLGNFDECLAQLGEARSERGRHGEVGSGGLSYAYACAGAVWGYRGNEETSHLWFERAGAASADPPRKRTPLGIVMGADVHLHHGRLEAAAAILSPPPATVRGEWRGWYGAMRAEALGGAAIDEAEPFLEGGVMSRSILDRARGDLEAAYAGFRSCGAAYQAARTALRMDGPRRRQAVDTYERLGLEVPAGGA